MDIAKPKPLFYPSENMFQFLAYRRFLMFSALNLRLWGRGAVFACVGPAIEFITDGYSGVVLFHRIGLQIPLLLLVLGRGRRFNKG